MPGLQIHARMLVALALIAGTFGAEASPAQAGDLPPLTQQVRPVSGGWFKEQSNLGNINFDVSDSGVVAGNWSTYKDGKPVWYYFQGQLQNRSFEQTEVDGIVALVESPIGEVATGSGCLTCPYEPPVFNAQGNIRLEFTSTRTARFIRNDDAPIEVSAWMQGAPLFAPRDFSGEWVMAVRRTTAGTESTPAVHEATVVTAYLEPWSAWNTQGIATSTDQTRAYNLVCLNPLEGCRWFHEKVVGLESCAPPCNGRHIDSALLVFEANDTGRFAAAGGTEDGGYLIEENGRRWVAYGDQDRILVRYRGDVDEDSAHRSLPYTLEIMMYRLPMHRFTLANSLRMGPFGAGPAEGASQPSSTTEQPSAFEFNYPLRPATGGWYQPNSNLGNINFDISDAGVAAGNWSTFRDGKPIWYYFQGTMQQTFDQEAQSTGVIAVAESPLYEVITGGACPTCPYVPPQGEAAHRMRIEFTSSRTARFIHDETLTMPLTAWMQGAPLIAPRDYGGDWLAIARYDAQRAAIPSYRHQEVFAQYRLEPVGGPEAYSSETLSNEVLASAAPPAGARRYRLVCKSPQGTCNAMQALSLLQPGATNNDFSLLWLGENETGTTVRAQLNRGDTYVLSDNAYSVYGERDRITLRKSIRRTTAPANPYEGVVEIVLQRLPEGVFDGASWIDELFYDINP